MMIRRPLPRGGLMSGLLLLMLVMTGCAGEGVRRVNFPGGFASRRVAGLSLDEVRPAAERAFRQYFRVDPELSEGDRWISRPTEAAPGQDPQRIREVLGTANRQRYIATLELQPRQTAVMIQCQVVRQRLDTAERAAFARERGDDRPTDTPIDRYGADAADGREEWVAIGRDRQAEALLLDSILEQLDTTQPAP